MLEDSHYYFQKAADVLNLPERLREILWTPIRIVKVDLVIDDDDGKLQHYQGYRVQHNKARGPMKGGLRYHPDMDEDHAAALENAITEDNVNDIKADIIIEGANGPTTPVAHEALVKRGVLVVPDILANAGGVIVSYFEWVQNIQQFRWKKDRVDEELTHKMREAYAAVRDVAEKENIDMRIAAFVLGIRRVGQAATSRAYVPEEINF